PLTAALLGTLLAGERTALPRHVTAAFTDTGTVHLLSVSGWHVTLIGGLCWGAARLALPRRGAAVATMAGLLAYGVLAGAQPPIVRATVAGLVVLAGLCLTRPADPLNTLALAALLIVAAAPRTIWMPAFQLSVVSVLALLTLAPLGMAAIRRCGLGMVQNPSLGLRLARGVLQSLVISTAAWLGTWPLVAYHLHRVSLVSGPANLVAVPVAALVMVTGLVVVVGGLIHAWIVWPWVGAVQLATHGLVAGLAWCARWPGAAIACPAPPVWMVLGWYLALAGAARGVNNIYKLYPEPEDA
ncbi:MAG: ComEC/Rec2 family competence protein, partial [Candidatus Omnitrophica bacterium]|nr:ComEC/Rec2 family competence protein [Candidatus Omnitrophota bacterium]